jgi:hypothetical protein
VSTGDGWAWAIARPLIGNIYPNLLPDDDPATPAAALRSESPGGFSTHHAPPWAPEPAWGPGLRGGTTGSSLSPGRAVIRRPVRARPGACTAWVARARAHETR